MRFVVFFCFGCLQYNSHRRHCSSCRCFRWHRRTIGRSGLSLTCMCSFICFVFSFFFPFLLTPLWFSSAITWYTSIHRCDIIRSWFVQLQKKKSIHSSTRVALKTSNAPLNDHEFSRIRRRSIFAFAQVAAVCCRC